MWRSIVFVVLIFSSHYGYSMAGPVGTKRNMEVRENHHHQPMISEPDGSHESDMPTPEVVEELTMSMMPPTLTLPSNATSIRSDITDVFRCEDRPYGYYADIENDCQIFHVCLPVTYADGKENMFRWSFICPEETMFSQDSFTCMRREDMNIDCQDSYKYYDLNRNFGVIEEETENNKDTVMTNTHHKHQQQTTAETVEDTVPSDSNAVAHSVLPVPIAPIKESVSEEKPSTNPIRKKPTYSSNYPIRKQSQSSKPIAEPAPVVEVVEEETEKETIKEEPSKPTQHKYTRRPVIVKTSTKVEIKKKNTQKEGIKEDKENMNEDKKNVPKEPVVQKEERLPVHKQPQTIEVKDAVKTPPKFDNTRVRPTSIVHKRKPTLPISNENIQEQPAKEVVPSIVEEPVKSTEQDRREEVKVPPTIVETSTTNLDTTKLISVPEVIDSSQSSSSSDQEKPVEEEAISLPVLSVPVEVQTLPKTEELPQEVEKNSEPIEAFPEIPTLIEEVVEEVKPSKVENKKEHPKLETLFPLPIQGNFEEVHHFSPVIVSDPEIITGTETKKESLQTNLNEGEPVIVTQVDTDTNDNVEKNPQKQVENEATKTVVAIPESTPIEVKPENESFEQIPVQVVSTQDNIAETFGTEQQLSLPETNADVEHLKQTMGGFKPVDPAKAAEAEALIADFLTTLMKAEAAHTKPTDAEESPLSEGSVQSSDEENKTGQVNALVENTETIEDKKPIEGEHETETEHKETMKEIDTQTLKAANLINFPMMNSFPADMYHIPVQVIQAPLEEMHHVEVPVEETHHSPTLQIVGGSEVDPPHDHNDDMEKDPTLAGEESVTIETNNNQFNPLNIDAIVSMVKERLDQMPPEEKDTPIQLVMQPVETPDSGNIKEVSEESEKLSMEPIIMPIYHRAGALQTKPTQTDESLAPERENSEVLKTSETKGKDTDSTIANVTKSGRIFRARSIKNAVKMDPRKRRFLFRKDAS